MARVERGGVVDQGRAYLLDHLAMAAGVQAKAMREHLSQMGIRPVRIGRREWVSSTAFVEAIDALTKAEDAIE